MLETDPSFLPPGVGDVNPKVCEPGDHLHCCAKDVEDEPGKSTAGEEVHQWAEDTVFKMTDEDVQFVKKSNIQLQSQEPEHQSSFKLINKVSFGLFDLHAENLRAAV